MLKNHSKLSICVPVFNFDVTELVKKLDKQAGLLSVPFEIVCIDDCSDEKFIKINKEICSKYGKYIELKENIGRSKIRNLGRW